MATVHQARAIFRPDLEADKMATREKKIIARRKSQQPFKAKGRQAFFAHLLKKAKEHLPPGEKLEQHMKVQIMKQHAEIYSMLSAEEQDTYCAQAAAQAQLACPHWSRRHLRTDRTRLGTNSSTFRILHIRRRSSTRRQVGVRTINTRHFAHESEAGPGGTVLFAAYVG